MNEVMVSQLDWNDLLTSRPPADNATKRYRRWRESKAGRRAYAEVVNRALALHGRGVRHFGMQAILEAIRYDWTIRLGPDAEGFKLNNTYVPFLSREVMAEYPVLDGFFEVRRSVADLNRGSLS